MTAPTSEQGCAAVRAALREPLPGSAPERAASWLLVEHPGPWPHPGLPPDLPPEVTRVFEAATTLAIRPQLIRPLRRRRRDRSTVVLASCRAGERWLETREVADLRELVELDLDAVAAGRAPGFGSPSTQPVVLVCTHGRRDVCCARLGRPVAQALDALLPGQVWETTHVGGDRFAANVVTLPHGSYHGGVEVASAAAVASAALRHEVVLEHLRGIAGTSAAGQVAEACVRRALDLTALDAVRAVEQGPGDRDGLRVTVTVRRPQQGDRCLLVQLRLRQVQDVRLTSCAGAGTLDRPHVVEAIGLTEIRPTAVA